MNKTKKFKQVLANHSRFLASRIAPEKNVCNDSNGLNNQREASKKLEPRAKGARPRNLSL